MTLGGYLAQRGIKTTIADRKAGPHGAGYMLGMLPIGGQAVSDLGLFDAYNAASCGIRHYEMFDRNGRLSKRLSLDPIASRVGGYRGIERGRLIDLLRRACSTAEFRWDTHVVGLENDEASVSVRFADGSMSSYDIVIGADGMDSTVRDQTFGEGVSARYETGWGGWVSWSPHLRSCDDCYRELWSAGWGIGLYPVADRLGIFLGGAINKLNGTKATDFAKTVADRLSKGPFRDALAGADFTGEPFFWEFTDQRSERWHAGRVVLLGDAATGFLPTAGVGASMAMEGAAVLAGALVKADPARAKDAFATFEAHQRHRVERAQAQSRALARIMFLNSTTTTFLRDQMVRIYPERKMVGDISRLLK